MTTAVRTLPYQTPPHGTPARYQGPRRHNQWAPCRCEDCRTAMRRAEKLRALHRQRGRNGFQNRTAVTNHLRTLLDHGWSGQQVATAAHISRKTVWNILNSDLPTVRHDTAQAILSLTPTERPDGMVPAIGAKRRVHALAAMGWPIAWTATQIDMSYTGLRDVSAGRTKSIQRTYYTAICNLYRTHAMRPGPSEAARRIASTKGWATAVAWDEEAIDNPAATPEGAVPTSQLTRDELAAYRRTEVEHLASFDLPEDDIARRLGLGVSTVHAIVRELRTGQRRDRTGLAA
ncbi:hypothetical protein ACIQ7D_18050 [Streptomyces sp. NPDC096310]|uniref:hypothetical protein n=1 Tax=Streptomyces sp. NPDC096310 TaxID=3366082 RepID=UPI0037FC1474